MKKNLTMCITALILLAALAVPVQLPAQEHHSEGKHRHHHYKLIDMGTFGGPEGYIGAYEYSGPFQNLNNAGMLASWADTPELDPLAFRATAATKTSASTTTELRAMPLAHFSGKMKSGPNSQGCTQASAVPLPGSAQMASLPEPHRTEKPIRWIRARPRISRRTVPCYGAQARLSISELCQKGDTKVKPSPSTAVGKLSGWQPIQFPMHIHCFNGRQNLTISIPTRIPIRKEHSFGKTE